jgi:PAS domain S-box-containing protein
MNGSKTLQANENFYWLAERNGIAVFTIDSALNCTLNPHAMLVFGIHESSLPLKDLKPRIKDFNKFTDFINNLDENNREYSIEVFTAKTLKNFIVSGQLIQNSNQKLFSIQSAEMGHENPEYLAQYAINSRDVFAFWNTKNELLYLSHNFEQMFGRTRNELNNNPFTVFEWMHPEDRAAFDRRKNESDIINAEKLDVEFRILLPGGGIKWIWYQKKALYDGLGKVYRYLAVLNDITLRKEAEQNLTLSQASLEQNLTPILWLDKDAKIIYTNPSANKELGYSEEELLSKTIFDIDELTPDSWPMLWERLKEKKADTFESQYLRKDGTKLPVEIIASFLNFDGEEYVFAYVLDISERKAFEKRIIHNQRFERLLLDISKRFINIPYNDIDQAIESALEEICKFTSTSSSHIYKYNKQLDKIELTHFYSNEPSKINQKNKYLLPVSSKSWHFKELSQNKSVYVPEVSSLSADDPIKKHCQEVDIGSFIDIGLFYQNRVYGFFGLTSKEEAITWDTDEIHLLQVIGDLFMNALQRRDSMRELLGSEQNYQEIYNATSEAIFIHNAESGMVEDVNNAMLKMYGISYEKALRSTPDQLSGPDTEQIVKDPLKLIKKAKEKPQVFEWLARKYGGDTFWTEVTLKRAEIHGETKIIAVVRDISDRKKTQKMLEESETKYRMIVEGQNDLIVRLDSSWALQFISPSFEKIFGKDLISKKKKFIDLILEEEQDLVKIAMEKLARPPHSCFFEFKVTTPSGLRWYAWNFSGVESNNAIKDFIGVGRDITYQKMVESALRESEDRFRSIVQNLSDVVFLLDEKANIKYVTPSCEQYLGMGVEELLGNNLLNLIHSDDTWLAEENIALHLEGADYSLPYELRFRHTSNEWKVFEAKSQNLLSHAAVNSIIFTISDVTERKLMEKQVLDAIIKTEEKERERFAKDLHDDLGPLLSSIKMYVGMLNKVKDDKKRNFILNSLQDIVKEAIATTKDVSNDLNPHVLNNYGLISALRLFIEKISKQIEIEFIEDIGEGRYSAAAELSLYRISKELINNTLKHAEATKIKLRIWEKGRNLNLLFEDNGKGMPEDALKVKKQGGMGLSNIVSRAKSLNAKHTFHTNLSNGFKFEMQVPLIQD